MLEGGRSHVGAHRGGVGRGGAHQEPGHQQQAESGALREHRQNGVEDVAQGVNYGGHQANQSDGAAHFVGDHAENGREDHLTQGHDAHDPTVKAEDAVVVVFRFFVGETVLGREELKKMGQYCNTLLLATALKLACFM